MCSSDLVMGSEASGGGDVLGGNSSATAANGLGAQARASCPQLQPLVQVLGPGPPMLTLAMDGNGNQKESQFKAEAKKKKSRPRSRPRPRAKSLADVNDNANGAWKCLQCDRVYEKQQSLAAHTQSHYREQAKKGMQKGGMNSYMHLQAEGPASEN